MSPRPLLCGTGLLLALVGVRAVLRATPVPVTPPVARAEAASPGGDARELLSSESDFLGVVLPEGTVDIAPRIEGRLESVRVREGDLVKKGAILATLDGGAARRDMAIAEAQLQSAQAEQEIVALSVAESAEHLQHVETAQKLQLGALSQDELTTTRYTYQLANAKREAARAKVRECQARVSRLQHDVDEAELRAPFDGVVASRFVDLGALVKPGQVLLHLLHAGTQRVRFAIPEEQARHVSVGQKVLVLSPTQSPSLVGRVSHVSPEVDVAARRVLALVELDPSANSGMLPSGAVVRVHPLPEQTARRSAP